MTYEARDRLEYYAAKWGEDAIQFDRLGIWAVILTMLGIQTVITGFVFQSHGIGPEAAASMATVFEMLVWLVFAWTVRWDSIAAAILTEAAYHLGYVDFRTVEEDGGLLEAVRSGGSA